MAVKESLLTGKVMHKRLSPKKNSFLYTQYYVFLKATDPWTSKPKLLSINKFNLFSFLFRKYGNRKGENPYSFVKEIIQSRCKNLDWLEGIYVLTQPSLLGWAFNPVSFWFYMDFEGNIRAVLSEVNNTFGEHHSYLAYHDDFSPLKPEDKLNATKVFYVSPFYKVEGEYEFRFKLTEKSLGVWIDYLVDGEKTLLTSITGTFKDLTDINLIKMFFQIPLANLKTVALIHWQAVILWIKGMKYISRKAHEEKDISRCR